VGRCCSASIDCGVSKKHARVDHTNAKCWDSSYEGARSISWGWCFQSSALSLPSGKLALVMDRGLGAYERRRRNGFDLIINHLSAVSESLPPMAEMRLARDQCRNQCVARLTSRHRSRHRPADSAPISDPLRKKVPLRNDGSAMT
jgi:hypothetical protein